MKKNVIFKSQAWKDFKTPPQHESDAYGPSSNHLWIYYPEDNYVTQWYNWSGYSEDIKELKKKKAMWCYCLKPNIPGETK